MFFMYHDQKRYIYIKINLDNSEVQYKKNKILSLSCKMVK
jgi:hypothetical protein